MGTVTTTRRESVMNIFLTLILAFSATNAGPQGPGALVLRKIVGSEYNPCGQGVKPNCVCISDSSITPSPRSPCPGGREDTDCTCPNGESFSLEEIKEKIKEANNPCEGGVEPTCSCQCPDGSTFTPKENISNVFDKITGGGFSGPGSILDGENNPCGAGNRPTCSCQCGGEGESFNPREKIQNF